MRVRFYSPLFAIASACAPLWAATNTNKFVLLQDATKQVGSCNYSIEKAKDGTLKIHSTYEYKVSPASLATTGVPTSSVGSGGRRGGGGGQAPGVPLFGQFLFDYKVDQNDAFLSGFTQDMSNQKMTSYQPGKQRERLTISQAQGGGIGLAQPITLPKPDYLIMPAFDASTIQLLLLKALEHPTGDNTYLLVTQGPGGVGNTPAYVVIVPNGTAQGTLQGKRILLKSYRLNFNQGHADAFTDESGKLMQADLEMLSTHMIRSGFAMEE